MLTRFIALKYLTGKRKEGFISVNGFFSLTGITLGVATLIIVMSVMNGFRIELMKRILGINAHITLYGTERNIANYQEIMEELKDFPGVIQANPLIDAQAMVVNGNYAAAGLIKGIAFSDLKNKKLISENIVSGDLNNFSQKDHIIIGNKLAHKLNIRAGDNINIVAPQTFSTVAGMIPRIKTYKVAATFTIGMHEYDSSAIFIPLEIAQIHFNYRNSVSSIEIHTENIQNVLPVTQNLRHHFLSKGYSLNVHDWQQANGHFLNALKVERNVMFLILTLIIIVAAFNIISSLVMLVNDKMKNIALMRTMGMSRFAIIKIFLSCGMVIGILGVSIGSILGVSFAYKIDTIKRWLESLTGVELFDPIVYFLTDLPVELNINTVLLIISFTLIICFLAALYPAWKASKLEPADILRYE